MLSVLSAGTTTTGLGVPPLGAVVSSMKLSEAVPVLPKVSVWLATMVCTPSARPLGVNDHAPLGVSHHRGGDWGAVDREMHRGIGKASPAQRMFEVMLSLDEVPALKAASRSPAEPWCLRQSDRAVGAYGGELEVVATAGA